MDIEQKLSVEQFLKPRYKVIADWPVVSGKVCVGDIIVYDDEMNVFWVGCNPFMEDKLNDYPHLFKKLQWWEERKESDMPEYVKYKLDGKVEKLRIFKINWSGYIGEYLPATESEYINQNKEHEG